MSIPRTYTHILLAMIMAIGLAAVPTPANASPVLRSGEAITVSDQQEVVGNFYAASASLLIDGAVRGDLHALAGAARVAGTIENDAAIMGGTVQIDGVIGDDLRVFAGELIIAGTVEGNLMVLGGSVKILSDARISGDVLLLSGDVDVSGAVAGSITGRADTVRIHGAVEGDISVTARRILELGNRAHIDGDIAYRSPKELVRAPDSVVVGDIARTPYSTSGARTFSIVPLLVLLFTSLVYAYLFRQKLEYVAQYTLSTFGFNSIVGLLSLLALPLVAVLLIVSVIGMPVGVTLLLVMLSVFAIAWSLAGVVVGAAIAQRIEGAPAVSVKWVLIGALTFGLVSYLPYIGMLVATLIVLMVAGALLRLIYASIRG